jgi:alpha-galactosidase
LGDWSPSAEKLPHGLDGVAKDVSAFGLKFGIWAEPEADPTDSNLCRLRPDGCLHVPSRARTTGRSQLVPDLSRQDVRGKIYEHLHAMPALAHAECVKWNMSRRLSAACVQDWNARRQGEVRLVYALGAYMVFSRITAAFPVGLFVPCSGGGGRFDAGTLYISPRVWTSDDTVALSRARFQYCSSLAYPASTMGARVSTAPNRLTLRCTTVKTRSLIAVPHWVAAERTHPEFLILSTASATSSGCSLRARPALPAWATSR